jgi:DNA polymerase-3 subunit delta'
MRLADVLGHGRVRALLGATLRARRVPPALLLSGPEGVGKRTTALALAQALVCEAGAEGDACGTCAHCRRVGRAGESLTALRKQAEEATDPERRNVMLHPDLVFAEPRRTATRTELVVDQVRGLLKVIESRPFEARARAVIVDDAHALNEQAANALLKSLEEPPPTSYVLLVTAAPQGLLPTIRSRCQVLRFGPLPAAVLEERLRSVEGLSADEARLRAALCAGSLGAALAFESEAFREKRSELLDLLERAPAFSGLERLEAAEKLEQADEPQLALTALRSLLRDLAALRGGAGEETLLNRDEAERLAAVARGPLGARALEVSALIADTRTALKENANKLLSMDLVIDALSRAS